MEMENKYYESLLNEANARGYTYKPAKGIPYADTKDMVLKDKEGKAILSPTGEPIRDNEVWLKARNGIGGSSVSTILEENPWTSGQAELDRLLGVEVPKEEKNSLAMHIGTTTERHIREEILPYVLKNSYELKNFKIGVDSRMFRHGNKEFSFALADIDGWIQLETGEVGIIEVKSTNPFNSAVKDYWMNGILPPYYERQVRHYMAVMNKNFAYVICAWGFNPETDAVVIRVDRDLALEEQQMLACKVWWELHVVEHEPIDYSKISAMHVASVDWSYVSRRVAPGKKTIDFNKQAPLVVARMDAEENLKELSKARLEAEKAEEKASAEVKKLDLQILEAIREVDPEAAIAELDFSKDEKIRIYVDPKKKADEYSASLIAEKHPEIYEKLQEENVVKTSVKKTGLSATIKSQLSDCVVAGAETGDVTVKVKREKLKKDE